MDKVKEMLVNGINKMNEEELKAFLAGINQITFEYGWGDGLDDAEMIKEIYKMNYEK